jgi:pyruvate,orthophosphate dikinase
MSVSVGVLTTRGGLVSHAAVVARGWGIPAVVGAEEITLVDNEVRGGNGLTVRSGDVITIDGATGQVWRGTVREALANEDRVDHELPQLARLEEWASDSKAASA